MLKQLARPPKPDTEVVFISARPLNPNFAGGFAPRHAAFVAAVAARRRSELLYLHDGDDSLLRNFSPPEGLSSVASVDASKAGGLASLLIPRQSVARGMRLPHWIHNPLVVTLNASVAHTALSSTRHISILEEAWERGFPPAESTLERARYWAEALCYRRLYRQIGRSARHVIAITPREQRFFAGFMTRSFLTVIPFGVDTSYFSPQEAPVRDIDVLVVGALNRWEQQVEDLIFQLRKLPETRGVHCVLVGRSPRASVRCLSSETIQVHDNVVDIRPYYARAKVVAIPTFTDVGIKTTMLQAWAMERPVVTSRSVWEGSEHAASQAQLAVETVGEMAEAIARLLRNPAERMRLGSLARLVVVRHHEQVSATEQFADLVETFFTANPGVAI